MFIRIENVFRIFKLFLLDGNKKSYPWPNYLKFATMDKEKLLTLMWVLTLHSFRFSR
jgi:hypothetical protein